MCPQILQANLFIGGQCTLVIDLCNTVKTVICCSTERKKKEKRNKPGNT